MISSFTKIVRKFVHLFKTAGQFRRYLRSVTNNFFKKKNWETNVGAKQGGGFFTPK